MSLMKPAKWAITPGLVDPNWRWFWRNLVMLAPLWEGQGQPFDIISWESFADISDAMNWEATTRGIAPAFDGSNSGVISPVDVSKVPQAYPFTTFVVAIPSPVSTFDAAMDLGSSLSSSLNYAIEINSATPRKWMMFTRTAAGGRQDASNITVVDGKRAVLVAIWRSATDRELYIDGVSVMTATSSIIFSAPNRKGIGLLADSSPSSSFTGAIEIVGCSTRAWTPEEVAIWSRDPFGPLRMADEARVVYSLPAAGGAFPPPFSRRLNPLLRM